ncbi:iron-containing alcohol dehydrogenase [Thecamonas trahens ATCC 50062]|uniref:Iron-containing alcohol dehydrogenase n=1 Tax=Thecamonas trahens ATCC 50062 TaxID=461836 RepID=A0A0L0DHP5_THETB|nr:iron-containing alcohol dehydrogenase [Thecamonas trahens ATCC 50062]KNC51894.1 iron-containing alcohol dehydrogenase [Thecamonas trahens ATCC 50062]|eukprot:XP_013755751.1 iron-containing alcohol dehydrogenase [Thecamonas trahens ATCC 50062]
MEDISGASPGSGPSGAENEIDVEYGFDVKANNVTFGLETTADVIRALESAGHDVVVYDEVTVEPTDGSFLAAGEWVAETKAAAYVSVGGGSVMDTTKAGIVYGMYPHRDGFYGYINKPMGSGDSPSGLLAPHIAVPTTSGTGSETTGFAVCDVIERNTKTALASKALIPVHAVVDPAFCDSLTPEIICASGYDVLCHAMESYTARPYFMRAVDAGTTPATHDRPLNQGANPIADIGCIRALELCAQYLVRAVTDADDVAARDGMMLASTVVGTAMGNAGTALCHGMSYPVSAFSAHGSHCPSPESGYPDAPLLPHGMSVMMHAPAAFAYQVAADPGRHAAVTATLAQASAALGLRHATGVSQADLCAMAADDTLALGEVLSQELIAIMRATGVTPPGLSAVGITMNDIPGLVERALPQKRVLNNAPFAVSAADLSVIYEDSLNLW